MTNRRSFLKAAACVAAGGGVALLPSAAAAATTPEKDLTILGPKPGYSPAIGTLTSMMAFMRMQVSMSVSKLSIPELDFLLDAKANTIGAMLLHLAATETYYQLHTFEGLAWDAWPAEVKQKWDAASHLGDEGRKSIKGHDVGHYLGELQQVRAKTLAELKRRDDQWLFKVDEKWPWGPTNNHAKWFHVVEHEANHNGQIKLIKGRLPGAKEEGG